MKKEKAAKAVKKTGRRSIRSRLFVLSLGILIPFIILAMYLVINLVRLTNAYDKIVRNITTANSYNIEFKKSYDYVLYRMIINSVNVKDTQNRLGLQDPYSMVDDVISEYTSLEGGTSDADNERRIRSILRMLKNLKKYTGVIDDNITTGGKYDTNVQMLELDIRNVTELVLENTQEYIYYEATAMEDIRTQLVKQRTFAITLTAIVFTGCIIWSVLLIRNMQKNISRPLAVLSDKTKQVADGDFNVRAVTETGNNEEILTLNESFNNMTRHIGTLVDNIRREQDEQRKTELRLLQAQINPHFLYNTLDTIIWLAEAGEKKQVVSMVGALSDFFRTTLSKGQDFITVKEEELHVHSYLRIQRFRYQDILDYHISFPEEVLPYTILKLTLQPIVENALYHGIKEKRGKGLIEVRAELVDALQPDSSDSFDEKDIRFTVTDNGVGMNPEELKNLRDIVNGRRNVSSESSGFGLRNVNERIRLNYGKQYGLRLESKYGIGTTVTILIPARMSRIPD